MKIELINIEDILFIHLLFTFYPLTPVCFLLFLVPQSVKRRSYETNRPKPLKGMLIKMYYDR